MDQEEGEIITHGDRDELISGSEKEVEGTGLMEKWRRLPTPDKAHYALLAGFLLLNAADAMSTYLLLQNPNTFERNQVMAHMIETWGPAVALSLKASAALIPLAMTEGGRMFMRAFQANELVVRASSDIPLVLADIVFASLVVNNVLLIKQSMG